MYFWDLLRVNRVSFIIAFFYYPVCIFYCFPVFRFLFIFLKRFWISIGLSSFYITRLFILFEIQNFLSSFLLIIFVNRYSSINLLSNIRITLLLIITREFILIYFLIILSLQLKSIGILIYFIVILNLAFFIIIWQAKLL